MRKLLEKNHDNMILNAVIALIVLGCIFSIIYTYPRNISCSYNGIKYNAGNPTNTETVKISVDGQYKKALFKKEISFWGKIMAGDKSFDFADSPLIINKYGMGILDYIESGNANYYGNIFVDGIFKKVSIEVLKEEKGGYSWNSQDGCLIAAPCNDRKEAVEISNLLEQRQHKDIVIK